ncbi:MAG: hypothetical protein ABL308_03105 [Oceanicaulis sp.]
MNDEFDTGGYRRLLDRLDGQGYRFDRFEDRPEPEGVVYLRHDVDFDLDLAVRIGAIESDAGLRSTFFILVSGPFYNCMENRSRSAVRELVSQGHEVGLHFDVTASHVGADYDAAAAREAAILSDAAAAPCRVVSFHRPAQDLLGGPDRIGGLISTYGKSWFKAIAYCSDSRGLWRFGRPEEQKAYKTRRSMQLLTHPIWWAFDTAESPEDRLRRLTEIKHARLLDDIADNSTVKPSRSAA